MAEDVWIEKCVKYAKPSGSWNDRSDKREFLLPDECTTQCMEESCREMVHNAHTVHQNATTVELLDISAQFVKRKKLINKSNPKVLTKRMLQILLLHCLLMEVK